MEAMYCGKGDLDAAAECIRKEVALLRTTSRQKEMAGYLNNLGLLLVDQKKYDQALSVFRETLELFRRLGIREQEAELIGVVATEESRWTEISQRLDELERALGPRR
jgi:tetratricopeptide (TPR) repeat protein